MPWLALPFRDRATKESLSAKYGVRGIPTLVVLDSNANLITTDAKADVDKYLHPLSEVPTAPRGAVTTEEEDEDEEGKHLLPVLDSILHKTYGTKIAERNGYLAQDMLQVGLTREYFFPIYQTCRL